MKKILAILLLRFTATSYGVVNIIWSASAGFYFNVNPSVGILGDGTGHSTRAQLMYSPDNIKDDLNASGAGVDNDVILTSVAITEDGVLGNMDDYACFSEYYTGPFTAGYVYAVIFQDNVYGGGDWYYYTPMVALQDITGVPQIIEMNTDRINGDAIDSGPNVYQNPAPSECVLTGSAGPNGTVSPASTNVYESDNVDFVITADSYYRIASLTTNGTAVTGMSFDNNSTSTNFTWGNVQGDGTLAATFTAQVAADPASTPYTWLAQYGLTNFDADAMNDVDLDGLNAWQEYIAGTNPTNSASSFCVTGDPRNVLGWSAVSGRVYSVYWTTNLLTGFQCLESNIPWTQVSFTNSTDVPCGYYKIGVQLEN